MKLYKWNAIASHAVNIKTRKTLFHADKIFPVKPLVPLRDQDPIFSHNINITGSSQVMRIKKNINWGIISWSIQNSPNWHRENLMTESEENYEQDLGSERVNLTSKFHRNILHKEVCYDYTFRVSKSLPCAKKLFFFWTQHWQAYLYTLDEAFSKCIMNYDFMLNVFIILEHNKK